MSILNVAVLSRILTVAQTTLGIRVEAWRLRRFSFLEVEGSGTGLRFESFFGGGGT